MRAQAVRSLGIAALAAALVPGMLMAPKPTLAMPNFAQGLGVKCSLCHTMVPLLNSYGRYVQRTAYAAMNYDQVKRAIPGWIDESLAYDSTAGKDTGTPRFDFGNLAVHVDGYATRDVTVHVQQWLVQGSQSGGLDTAWISYNNLFNRQGHLIVGKSEAPAPSAYSMTSDLDGPAASSTLVGEHDWGATIDNRWGAQLAYSAKNFQLNAGYFLSGEDLNGLTDFGPGDKTFMWKAAITSPKTPFEYGLFGSNGSVPVSTGIDSYRSTAAYVQLDPDAHGRPGFLAIYQNQADQNPGFDSATNLQLPATYSHGVSLEAFEPVFKGNLLLSARHDFNFDGAHTFTNGNSFNAAFNVPWFTYLHGYLEMNTGGTSGLYGASGGPTWKGQLWLALPVSNVKQ
jgi:hypothetical protein